MSKFSFYIFIGLLTSSVAAEVIEYKPLQMTVQNKDRLFIQGYAGKLDFQPVENSQTLVITLKQVNPTNLSGKMKSLLEEWMFVMDRKGSQIRLVISGPASRKDWAPIVRQKMMPQYELVIRGPSLPIKVSWWNGEVHLRNWKAPAELKLLDGKAFIEGMEGDLRLFEERGSVSLRQHKGLVNIGSYQSQLVLSDIVGDVELENFAGQSQIVRVKGAVNYQGYKGTLRLSDTEGDIHFDSRQVMVHLEKHQGDIKGKSAQGKVDLNLVGKVNVDIRSQEGDVALKLRGSGASVNLGSKDGLIYAPSYLRSTNYPTIKVKQGRLRGKDQGRVFVRTDSGKILLR
ncbi:MAG: DUF4097 family beta strand repeat protein [Bdellovibrionales bacterium]|nr:DUF4097 family beta strand repeat protein [Bdellovibrionales bacterium]